jgi:hypothetical protein
MPRLSSGFGCRLLSAGSSGVRITSSHPAIGDRGRPCAAGRNPVAQAVDQWILEPYYMYM